jgi:hypothetical protein
VLNAPAIVVSYVLEKLEAEPLSKRALMYRSLATLAASPAERTRFNELADECVAIERHHQQLALDFKRAAL